LISGEVIAAIINGFNEIIAELNEFGVQARLAGGETADVGDLVKTIIVDSTVFASMERSKIIENKCAQIMLSLDLLRSEKQPMKKNIIAVSVVMDLLLPAMRSFKEYAQKYPETFDHHIEHDFVYSGKI
jgi:phosphoribosylformylglycinamidine cyclo-ligase